MAKKKENVTENEEVLTEKEREEAAEKKKKSEKNLAKELEETLARLAETEDRFLRTLAEYDNFKKRTAREKEDIYFAAKADVIKKLLPVFDNFDRAAGCTDPDEFRSGVDMIIQQFFHSLEEMEIREIAKEGDEFDPVFHEAVFREETEGVPENTITQVLQKGYAMGDKVIRHAMVKVSG
jgi:molecular chaperone GrpE